MVQIQKHQCEKRGCVCISSLSLSPISLSQTQIHFETERCSRRCSKSTLTRSTKYICKITLRSFWCHSTLVSILFLVLVSSYCYFSGFFLAIAPLMVVMLPQTLKHLMNFVSETPMLSFSCIPFSPNHSIIPWTYMCCIIIIFFIFQYLSLDLHVLC